MMCKSDAEVIDKIISYIMNGDIAKARECYEKAMSELKSRLKEVTDENEEMSSMLSCIYLMMEGNGEYESCGIHSRDYATNDVCGVNVCSVSNKNV